MHPIISFVIHINVSTPWKNHIQVHGSKNFFIYIIYDVQSQEVTSESEERKKERWMDGKMEGRKE